MRAPLFIDTRWRVIFRGYFAYHCHPNTLLEGNFETLVGIVRMKKQSRSQYK